MESSDRVPSILAFVHAAEQGSFVAAARTLNISASAISKNISNLERSLGVRLLNRTTRSIQLTGEGQAFFERARIAIDALDHAIDSVTAHRIEPIGKVRISTGNATGNAYLLPVLPELIKRYPALNIEVDFDDRRVDLVREGYDLALRAGWLEDSSLISRPICHLPNVLVASTEYLRRGDAAPDAYGPGSTPSSPHVTGRATGHVSHRSPTCADSPGCRTFRRGRPVLRIASSRPLAAGRARHALRHASSDSDRVTARTNPWREVDPPPPVSTRRRRRC